MIAKLIVHAETREEAADALAVAASEVEVWPVKTNAGFLVRCLEHPRFVAGDVDTALLAVEADALIPNGPSSNAAFAALKLVAEDALYAAPVSRGDGNSPFHSDMSGAYGFRLNAPARALIRARVGDTVIEGTAASAMTRDGAWLVTCGDRTARVLSSPVHAEVDEDELALMDRGDSCWTLFDRGLAQDVGPVRFAGGPASGPASDGSLRAPMPGKIVATPAKAGDIVTKGQPLIVLEAMKMEHALVAPFDGVVESIGAAVGEQVVDGAVLAVVTQETKE